MMNETISIDYFLVSITEENWKAAWQPLSSLAKENLWQDLEYKNES